MTENELARIVVDIAFRIHVRLGPGLLESVYEALPAYELRKMGLHVVTQHPIPVIYESVRLEIGFRADLIIEDKLLIEVKSAEAIANVHKKQLLTYLKLTGIKLGLLINFGDAVMKNNIIRVVNGLKD